jgi:hypothetical protein
MTAHEVIRSDLFLYRRLLPADGLRILAPGMEMVVGTDVGTATFTFTDGNSATFAYTVDGVSQTKTITREIFRPPGTVCQ